MKRLLAAVLLTVFGFPTVALSCEEFIAFSDEQASEILGKIKTLDAGDMSTVFAFDRLLCAERKILRDSARQAGMQSNIAAIRSRALQSALFEKDVLNLNVMSKENMTDEEVKFLNTTPLISYHVRFIDPEKGCISLYDNRECDPRYVVSVSGSEVDLRYSNQVAKLRLAEKGELKGMWSNGDRNKPISVPVEIRLD